jgi:hypothetical protein
MSEHLAAVADQFRAEKFGNSYNARTDESILRQLCADDPRLYDFHALADKLSDEDLAWLLDGLLNAAAAGESDVEFLPYAKEQIAYMKRALDLLNEAAAVIKTASDAARQAFCQQLFPLRNPDDDEGARDDIVKAGNYLSIQIRRLEGELGEISRKTTTIPQETFMAEMPRLMEGYFGKPHFDVVADLASVLYETEVSAGAVQKARSRRRKAAPWEGVGTADDSTPK